MKDKLRKDLIQIRKNMPKKEVLEKSKQIKKRLFEMDEFKQASSILFYVSYGNEVYTHDMVKECLSKKRNVVVPVTDKENRQLILSKLGSWNDLTQGAYNILEPKKEKMKGASIFEIDLVIIPGVGFDEHGCRMGHGVGYYDDFLKDAANALHVGLAFEKQIVERIPVESHDIPVDKIVTEERIIIC